MQFHGESSSSTERIAWTVKKTRLSRGFPRLFALVLLSAIDSSFSVTF